MSAATPAPSSSSLRISKEEVPVKCLPCVPSDERACGTGPTDPDVLYVVTPVNNYLRYRRRYELFEKYVAHMESLPGIVLYVVEVALGERPFAVTDPKNPRHLQLRTNTVLWHKENMINQCVEHLPRNWKYVAWVDGDVEFLRRNIAYETIHALQTYDVVQMFYSVANLGPKGEILNTHKSFCAQYTEHGFTLPPNFKKYAVWHPGFAWACTRKAYNDMGRLLSRAILGAADHHMACALVGAAEQSIPGNISPAYRKMIMQWADRAEKTINRNIGFVDGTILHGFHGKFADRRYTERWKILVDTDYDPETDIKEDWQGLYTFDKSKPRLRDLIRNYFIERNEDTNEAT